MPSSSRGKYKVLSYSPILSPAPLRHLPTSPREQRRVPGQKEGRALGAVCEQSPGWQPGAGGSPGARGGAVTAWPGVWPRYAAWPVAQVMLQVPACCLACLKFP